MRTRVGIICGGPSTEHAVSLISAVNIVAAIDRARFEVIVIGVDDNGGWHHYPPDAFVTDANDPARIALQPSTNRLHLNPGATSGVLIDSASGQAIDPIDVFFPIIHGTSGEDGGLQGLLRWLNTPFVGTDIAGSAMAMDKDIAKRLLSAAGLATAPYRALSHADSANADFDALAEQLGTPLFIKPANQGSSVGVSRVTSKTAFKPALDNALALDHKVLVETAVTGREIECAVLGNEHPEVSGCGEIVLTDGFYSYETKYLDAEAAGVVVPADLPENVAETVRNVAATAFKALNLAGLARVDVFVTSDERVIVNEVNTLPGFTPISMYPKLFEHAGIGYEALVTRLIEQACTRFSATATP